jgi:hypothetical protein
VSGQAFLDCLIDFGGRPAPARSLQARATGRLTTRDAQYWAQRWKDCLPAPADAAVRVERLARSVSRWRQLNADLTAVEADMARLLALTDGQVLTTLPGVKEVRAACFSAFTLPIDRFPTASTCTPRRAWHRRATSPRASTAVAGSVARACPSTARP